MRSNSAHTSQCYRRRLSLASGIGQAVEVPIGGGSIDDGLNGSCVRWQANGYIQVAWPASCFSSCLYGLGRWSNYLRTNIVDSCLGRRYETRERQDDLCEDGSKLMKKNDLSSHSSFNSKICKYPLMHKHSPLDLGKLREIAVKTVRVCEREKYC